MARLEEDNFRRRSVGGGAGAVVRKWQALRRPAARPPTITPWHWRTPWVRRLKVDGVTKCKLFATTRRDSTVRGPHQTWKWILAKKGIDERAVPSRDHELYEFLRNIRQARIKPSPS